MIVATYEEEVKQNLAVISIYFIYIQSIIVDSMYSMMEENFREIALWNRRHYGIIPNYSQQDATFFDSFIFITFSELSDHMLFVTC
jgi:hypothetical protein